MGVPTFGAIILDETLDNVSIQQLLGSIINCHAVFKKGVQKPSCIHSLFFPEGVDGPGLSGQVWLGFS